MRVNSSNCEVCGIPDVDVLITFYLVGFSTFIISCSFNPFSDPLSEPKSSAATILYTFLFR